MPAKNPITLIERALQQHATKLDLSGCSLKKLPSNLHKLVDLRHLKLASNELRSVSPGIERLTKLTTLDLGGNRLKTWPRALMKLTNLSELNLERNHITKIPASIAKLSRLKTLDVSNNDLEVFPPEIGSLARLQNLLAWGNRLSELPPEISQLKKLAVISLGANHFDEVPTEIIGLSNLISLGLSYGKISTLPSNLNKLTNLQELHLVRNQITAFPPVLTTMRGMQILRLNENQLASIPKEIGKLTNLTVLELSNNKLTTIPKEIGKLTNLVELSLAQNNLTIVPTELVNLVRLRTLSLSGNKIISIPPEITRLKSLTSLNLRANQLPIPPETLSNPEDVKAILAAVGGMTSGTRLNEAKMLVVGDGNVGKSSLVEQLIYGTFNPQKSTTLGVDIRDQMQILESLIGDEGNLVKLNIWDFGGQEIQHSTHQFFLTTRSLYLLVVDARKGDQLNNTEYWLKLIQSFGGDSPIIVVINQIDQLKGQRPLNLDRNALQEKYHICAFVETSCETGQGIQELKTTINREIEQLKHVRDIWPREWIAIKQRLKEMQADYLSVEQYLGICAEEKLNDQELQQSLLDILHVLGTVIRFPGDTQVLNPRWVTEGVYALLTSKRLVESQGQFDLEDVGEILAGVPDGKKHYPPHTHERLIRVMRHFELCFEFTDRPGHYLIPRHVHDIEPAIPWKDDDALKFQYHYETLPDSVISRFIVRMNQFITERHYWKNGVFLESDGGENFAKVKADMVDRKIFISVTGKEQTRRAFLAVIRSAFDEINSNFKIEIGQMIPMPGFPQVLVSYKDLLAYEESNEPEIFIPELRKRFPVRELLDGVEELRIRMRRRQRGLNRERFPQPSGALSDLRKQIVKSMSDDEIETLAVDLGVDYENLKGDTKEAKARELVLYCDRSGNLSDLIELCRAARPNLTWNVTSI